jgi:hypothetical protein
MDNRPFVELKREPLEKSPASVYHGLAEVERRLRTLEERYSTLDRRSQVTEENMLNNNRKIRVEIKLINEELPGIKSEIESLGEKIKALIREFQGFARVEDVEVIRKYLNLIEPLGFVTQNEVERIVAQAVKDALDEQLSVNKE